MSSLVALSDISTKTFSVTHSKGVALMIPANYFHNNTKHDWSLWDPLYQREQCHEIHVNEASRYSQLQRCFDASQEAIWKGDVCNTVGKQMTVREISIGDGEYHGYQLYDSPLSSDAGSFIENSELKVESNSKINGSKTETISESEGQTVRKEASTSSASPFLAKNIHDGLLCCTNGFFAFTNGLFSEFEGNCSCTTRSLVDWQTRVSWTNPVLRHHVKVNEATYRSPFRCEDTKRLTPFSISRLLPVDGVHYLDRYKPPRLLSKTNYSESHVKESAVNETNPVAKYSEVNALHVFCLHTGCGRTFYRNEELARHTRIHTGQKPFLCQLCGRGFVRRDHLAKHQRTHLPAHAKRTYCCPLPACVHSYTRSDALTRHMWTAHQIRARQPSRPRTRSLISQKPKNLLPKSEAALGVKMDSASAGPALVSLPQKTRRRGEDYAVDGLCCEETATEAPLNLSSSLRRLTETHLSINYGLSETRLPAPTLELVTSRNTAFRVIKNSRRRLC
ncbi:zinc finger protein 239-like [Macrobrachium nipponense]|uniref:zinc finger protein 239-like n=1 Tax=Macrobrachium nipponense TaxID=159736 RepID=UPI0030C7CDC7